MIIVYDDDEKVASGVATLFVQKGWENIYMMSGGAVSAHTIPHLPCFRPISCVVANPCC